MNNKEHDMFGWNFWLYMFICYCGVALIILIPCLTYSKEDKKDTKCCSCGEEIKCQEVKL